MSGNSHQPHQQSAKADGDNDKAFHFVGGFVAAALVLANPNVFFLLFVPDPNPVTACAIRNSEYSTVHDILVVVGKAGLYCYLALRFVRKVIGRTAVQVEGGSQEKRKMIRFPEVVNFAVDIQQQFALECHTGGLQAVDMVDLVAVRVQRRDFENVLKEGDAVVRGGCHCYNATILKNMLVLMVQST